MGVSGRAEVSVGRLNILVLYTVVLFVSERTIGCREKKSEQSTQQYHW